MHQEPFGNLPVGTNELWDKLMKMYDVVCLLDLERDTLFQLKYPSTFINPLREREVSFSQSLPAVVEALVCADDQSTVLSFLAPERIRTAFGSINDQLECTFLSRHDHWKQIILMPFDCEQGVTRHVLYLHVDRTPFHIQYERLSQESMRLRQLCEHDELTYLFNRTKLATMMDSEYRVLSSCAVLFFDINSLKEVNDTLGHKAGDTLLCQFAESIRSIANHDVHPYRYGGDEFIVVVCNAQESELDMLLEMWRDRLNHLIRRGGIPCSVAVGRAYSSAPFVLSELILEADKAMYENKRKMKQSNA